MGWRLSEKGHQVTIFEKRDRIGKEVCSGLFSERIFEFVPESQKLIQNKIEHCLIHFPRRTLKIRFSKPFFVINHYQLDNLSADLAEKAGAKIILNSSLLKSDFNRLENEFERIIGCDGANSVIREGLRLAAPDFWLAIQGFITSGSHSNFVETWPTEAGFIWKIPRDKETEWGIIEKAKRARKLFEEFIKEKGIAPEKIKSAIVPQGLIIPKNPKITLLGDAAGLTKPWSGGGVIWGLIAANLLLKNFPDFIKYQKAMKRFFLPKIILSKTAKKLVYFLGFNLPWFLPKNSKIESDFLT